MRQIHLEKKRPLKYRHVKTDIITDATERRRDHKRIQQTSISH